MKSRLSKRTTTLLFCLVIAAACVFRVTNLDYIEYKADESINLFLASRPIFGHPFPPGSTVSSLGILNPPLMNYLLFPATIVTTDPKMISFYVALVNVLSVGLFFLLVKRYHTIQIALFTSLLLAFSPWAILYSRKIWAQDFIVPLMIPLLFATYKIVLEKKSRFWILYLFSALLLIQIHQSTIFFLLIFSFFLWRNSKKISWRYILWGFLIGTLPLLPYLYYQITQGCPDCNAVFQTKSRLTTDPYWTIFLRPLQIINQGNFYFELGDDLAILNTRYPLLGLLKYIFFLEYILLLFGMIKYWFLEKRTRWFVYPILLLPPLYFVLRIEPFTHYFIILLPFLFLFLAKGLTIKSNRNIQYLAFFFVVILISVSIYYNYAFYSLLTKEKTLKGDYGMSFILHEQEVKENLAPYKSDKFYDEMLLASYIPKLFLYGNLPVGKILYPRDQTEKQLQVLEGRLKTIPVDARVQNELISYYTFTDPSSETLVMLKRKTEIIPGYAIVLDEVEKLYLQQHPIQASISAETHIK